MSMDGPQPRPGLGAGPAGWRELRYPPRMNEAWGPLLDRLFEGVKLHMKSIAEIASRGEISIMVVEPSESWTEALRMHGWNEQDLFAMGERVQKALSCADSVTERWIASPRSGTARIFAVIHDESMLVNSEGGLLSVEPESTDEGECPAARRKE